MDVIKTSAEHHFLASIEDIRHEPKGWVVGHFAFSQARSKPDFNPDFKKVLEKLSEDREQSIEFITQLENAVQGVKEGQIYLFADNDVVFLGRVNGDEQCRDIEKALGKIAEGQNVHSFTFAVLKNDIYAYQKMADRKMNGAKLFEAYEKMSDKSRISSIAARRNRREHALVLVIEDDRFTSSYATGILSKDYDVIVAKTGEEGITAYIEHAPDIVFIDIHLPGINGHQALQAIKSVDIKAFAVMLSVDTVKENIIGASKGGAKNFIKKPFSKERLIEAVKTSPYVRGSEMVEAGTIVN